MTVQFKIPAPDAPAEEWGRLAVSIPGWRWMPGMLDAEGAVVVMVKFGVPYVFCWDGDGQGMCASTVAPPDPDDPATAGCLLALLNPRRWDSPAVEQWISGESSEYRTLGRACIAAAAALGRWPGGDHG